MPSDTAESTAALRRNRTLAGAVDELSSAFEAANPASLAHFSAHLAAMPGANTRSVLHYAPFPLVIAKGEGARLTDLDGHTYIDFLNDYTAGLYGHSHPVLQQAMQQALQDGVSFGGPNRYEGPLAALMCTRFPSLEQVRFCNSGTEANLMAVSLARHATGRSGLMVFQGGYHGSVFYYAGNGSPINAPFPTVVAPFNDIPATRLLIETHGEDLACILVEPMQGSAGALLGDAAFLTMLREEADQRGIVLIFDEVMTSRLSPGGLQAHFDILPDLTSFGKYLGGGNTFGAFGGKADLMRHFDPRQSQPLPHSGTYNNNILSMAAGYKGLSELYTPESAVALNQRGDQLREQLNAIAKRQGVALHVSGFGSIMAFHFSNSDQDDACRQLLHLALLAKGIYLARRGFISLSLALTEADYDAFMQAFEAVLSESNDVLPRRQSG